MIFSHFKPPRSIAAAINELHSAAPGHWERAGERMALRLFKHAASEVPAYKKFLAEHGFDPSSVRAYKDFSRVPLISKDSYIRTAPLHDFIPRGDMSRLITFSATSGSSGTPTYFPRTAEADAQYRFIADVFLRNQFRVHEKSTLGIIGFGLGIWIGGIFTYKVMSDISEERRYPFSIAPTGPLLDIFLSTLKKFGTNYDQVILMGYPPFIRDVVDAAPEYGIQWEDYSVKILTAAEGFSERFRSYIAEKAQLKNPLTDFINIYGTVELGTMAHETALTNLIRRHASLDQRIRQTLFPTKGPRDSLPTLAQYYPFLTHFEADKEEVIGSGFGSALPLPRYRFGDKGGVIPFERMRLLLAGEGINLEEEAKRNGISRYTFRLPFVYVHERAENSLVFRGANIYADEIRAALEDTALESDLTGRCVIRKRETRRLDSLLEVHVELRKGKVGSSAIKNDVAKCIIAHLKAHNTEYADQYAAAPKKVFPHVSLWEYGNTRYFSRAGKQRWVGK